MRAFTIYYNENKDETSIKKSEEFKSSSCILRLDIMKDVLYDLTEEYNKALNSFCNEEIGEEV